MISVEESVEYLRQQVANHSIYVWGGQGQTGSQVTERWIRRREQDTGGERVNGKYMTYADMAVEFWKKQCAEGYGDVLSAFDCSGLFSDFLLKRGAISHDITAHGLYQLTTPTTDRRAGYWVFRISNKRAVHIGQLIDENTVIHAKGRRYGVVEEKYSNFWHAIGIPSVYNFEPAGEEKVKVIGKKTRSIYVRSGNGKTNKAIGTAHGGDEFPYLGQASDSPYWYNIEYKGDTNAWITSSPNYTEVIS